MEEVFVMFNLIKDTYKLYLKKMPLWILFVLPLIAYSLTDDVLREKYAGCSCYLYCSMFLGPLVFSSAELFIYRHVMKFNMGKIWGFLKKVVLFTVAQFVMGLIMIVPMFIWARIANHHNIGEYWLVVGLIVNVFLGIWLFAKINVLLPMIACGDGLSFDKFKKFSTGSYTSWLLASAFIYFPYIASYYLISNGIVNVVITSIVAVLMCLFNALYYQSKVEE